ncbi:MAG: LysM peptidoglycan-binding domain-containing protein, partial [Anaerolineales bacterium]|nr:LysM peptidoglycan-binding domain-containing protein [Anaerolineales bacterium]
MLIKWRGWRILLFLLVVSVGNGRILAQTPEPTPPPDTSLIPLMHSVQDGENLTIIAQNYGVTVAELLAINGLTEDSLLFVGQELLIPGGEGEAVATVHTVQFGDTVAGVAAAFNTTPQDVIATNRVVNPYYTLTAGQSVAVVSRTGSALPQAVTGSPHLVAIGETLGMIAAQHQIQLAALAAANGLPYDAVVVPGQRLRIPDESAYQYLNGEWVDVQLRPLPVT